MTGKIAQKVALGRGDACAVFTYLYETLVVNATRIFPALLNVPRAL